LKHEKNEEFQGARATLPARKNGCVDKFRGGQPSPEQKPPLDLEWGAILVMVGLPRPSIAGLSKILFFGRGIKLIDLIYL